ncbi:MAG: bifunctional 3,4-dihydroxy-2-butanone-4-phosphate synthase/GTP cyclohydrolase II [Verrucomicrobiales bacterium]|jgi:3,4-dihydroxy 2-butanone 4-phosphate synthase/GTP cyclohydrolase II|nr:bifunctional 3,4-dihydroxy-2-butanone-4-phosphate synthase/GTP cyclohydrolase II [Verrucomicrobiales bacterium]
MKKQSSKASAKFSPIEDIIADVRKGKLVIMTDDPDRENEGDVIVAAEKVTPAAINFMVSHARGLVCAPITQQRAKQLGLQRMVADNRDSLRTDYTVSVDAARDITTGISAPDRAKAVKILSQKKSAPADLIQPGHIFPLQAKPGGVLQRAGHTEAAVDLARLAGLDPSAAICEVMKDDGEMARLPDLLKFAFKHKLKIGSIKDLIEYRRRTEKLVVLEETVSMPTDYGIFDLHLYRSSLDGVHHLALSKGKINPNKAVLVRVHSECLTGDIFGSRRCDCGSQLHDALRMIDEEGSGVLVYMRGHEGRGIGIGPKIHAYKLQEQGYDTIEANVKLGFPEDLREYGIGAQILYDLGVRKMRLMTNNPKKVVNLAGYGLKMISQVPIRTKPNKHNKKYLETKKTRMGHTL